MQKRAKKCISSTYLPKNVHLKVSFTKKTCKNVQKTCKNVQKRAKSCKNVHLKCFWTLFKNVHCQGPCILRPCISRPYCIILEPIFHFCILSIQLSRILSKQLINTKLQIMTSFREKSVKTAKIEGNSILEMMLGNGVSISQLF